VYSGDSGLGVFGADEDFGFEYGQELNQLLYADAAGIALDLADPGLLDA
jgi:hypothetical protein